MASATEKQANLLSYAPLSLSAPDDQEQYSRKPQELPVDAEQIHSEFSPGEEYSTNNQPEEQQPKLQAEVARPQEIHSHLSLYAAWYTEYENSQHGPEATPPMVKIPYKMMLDVLLESLALPPAEYRSKQCGGTRVCVTVFSTHLRQMLEMIAVVWLSLECNLSNMQCQRTQLLWKQ